MKVKDLIKQLSKLNPNSTLLFSNCVESGRSFGGCAFEATGRITDMSKEQFIEEAENVMDSLSEDRITDHALEDLITKVKRSKYGVVVFTIQGEENWNE